MRISHILPAVIAAVAIVAPAHAADFQPFTQTAFEKAQESGKPILIDVHADWCPTCARQAPIIKALGANPANKDLIVFTMDYDRQKDAQRPLRITKQSTLIAFKGDREVARSIGETDPDRINAMVAATIG